jgi:hypothetical protein
MATTPYTVLELGARRKKLGDFNFVKQIADLLNAMETEIDKPQELLDAYRKAAISPVAPPLPRDGFEGRGRGHIRSMPRFVYDVAAGAPPPR